MTWPGTAAGVILDVQMLPATLCNTMWTEIVAPSRSGASHNTPPRQLRGIALWWSRIRADSNRNGEFNWLTSRHVSELQTPQNSVTLPSDVIFWAALHTTPKSDSLLQGLFPLKQTIAQVEITFSFRSFFFGSQEFQYHLLFKVLFSPGTLCYITSQSTSNMFYIVYYDANV